MTGGNMMLVKITAARWEDSCWGQEGVPMVINLANVISAESWATSGPQDCTRMRFVGGGVELIKMPFETFVKEVYQALGCKEPE